MANNMYSGNNANGKPTEELELVSNPSLEETKKLAKSIEKGIGFEFTNYFLVKELPRTKVKKAFVVPTSSDDKATEDKNGIEAVDYETSEEIKEVDSDYATGVVLKVPAQYAGQLNTDFGSTMVKIEVGDIIAYKGKAPYFDLFKDCKLVQYYDIVSVKR